MTFKVGGPYRGLADACVRAAAGWNATVADALCLCPILLVLSGCDGVRDDGRIR